MKSRDFVLCFVFCAGTVACGVQDSPNLPSASISSSSGNPETINWKNVLFTGDDSINAFDNARIDLSKMFVDRGVAADQLKQLSRDPKYQTNGVLPTSAENLETTFDALNVQDGDGCAIFMTSHGTTQGFYIRNQPTLTPSRFKQIVDKGCGQNPTVILVSACYSGVFVEPLRADNRIILTAARRDRTSFGCGAEEQYTYWDGCLIDSFPKATTWQDLFTSVKQCVEKKESMGNFTPSEPQGSFGASVGQLAIFGN